MAIPKTIKEARTQAEQETILKMKLEMPLAKDFRRIFRQIGNDFAAEYLVSGSILDLEEYRADIIGLLRQHYRKVSDKFGYNLIPDVDKAKQVELTESEQGLEALVAASLAPQIIELSNIFHTKLPMEAIS